MKCQATDYYGTKCKKEIQKSSIIYVHGKRVCSTRCLNQEKQRQNKPTSTKKYNDWLVTLYKNQLKMVKINERSNKSTN